MRGEFACAPRVVLTVIVCCIAVLGSVFFVTTSPAQAANNVPSEYGYPYPSAPD